MSLTKKILFACVPMVVLLGSAELLIRWTGADESCPRSIDSDLWVCDPLLYFKTDPELIIRGEPVNSEGFRSPEFQPKQPGVFRILALGDSCTFGIAPDLSLFLSDPYPQLLEQRVAAEYGPGRVEVLNVGSSGYNSYQGLLLLRTKLRDLDPDLITVRFGWNDHLMSEHGRLQGAFRESSNPIARGAWNLLLRTALYPFATRVLMELKALLPSEAPAEVTLPTEWAPNMSILEYQYALREIARLGHEQGAQVWFLTAPQGFSSEEAVERYESLPGTATARRLLVFSAIPSFREMREIHDSYIAATRQAAKQMRVPLVDMDAAYRKEDGEHLFSLRDGVHPTQLGHSLEAELLFQELVRSGISADWKPGR